MQKFERNLSGNICLLILYMSKNSKNHVLAVPKIGKTFLMGYIDQIQWKKPLLRHGKRKNVSHLKFIGNADFRILLENSASARVDHLN